MKKKYAIWIVTSLTCTYMLVCILLLYQIDQSPSHTTRNGSPKGLLHGLFHPRCACSPVTEDHHIFSSSAAQALRHTAQIDKEMCMFVNHDVARHESDIQMYDVMQIMPISYPQYVYTHTGWIQEFNLKYHTCQWKEEPLRVIVVLHSHNDPGWLKTYEKYYHSSSKHILDEIVKNLDHDPKLKFVWAEMTYLAKWYEEAPSNKKETFRKLLERSQLELVTGGWVMTDEAVAHYSAMLDQLVEGHLWLKNTLNYTVKTGWAIDPFGHSSTMAYLLQKSGIGNMLIQRTHFAVKKFLGLKKQLEFHWTQNWDWLSQYAVFCHMMPFLSYDIRYSCGPDINTCCNYDFHSSKCWKWGKYQKAEPITEENIKQKAEALLDQYRKKAQLFDHNVLLVPHGDDFRYTSSSEWKSQTENLKKLFDYMNHNYDMRVKVQFGTLSDYFKAVEHSRSLQVPSCVGRSQYSPKLSGDFYTYNDRDDQYWSGYYTSRPFLKSVVRHFQSNLRSAEILYTLMRAYKWRIQGASSIRNIPKNLYEHLEKSRQLQGVLQHHDAITGTSKEAVVSDYLLMVHKSQKQLDEVMGNSIARLLCTDQEKTRASLKEGHVPHLMEFRQTPTALLHPRTLPLDTPEAKWSVVIFNPLSRTREELAHVWISSPAVSVYDYKGTILPCQVSPVLNEKGLFVPDTYQVSFPIELDALSIKKYNIHNSPDGATCRLAKIQFHNAKHDHNLKSVFNVEWEIQPFLTIDNTLLSVSFCSCTGLMQSVTRKVEAIKYRTEVRFVTYGTGDWKNPWRDKSGAYIFLPDGPAKELVYERPMVSVIKGPLFSSVSTYLPMVVQKITLINSTGNWAASVHVENLVNIGVNNNTELAMRVFTDVRNNGEFFTDVNGFQVHKRKTLKRLPIQGNVYPMTTMMYIQDDYSRVSLLSAQSHGVSSLSTGWMEVMLDRRLAQDDWRGLREGVLDNHPTISSFQFLIETRRPYSTEPWVSTPMGFPSLLAHSLSLDLNNQMRFFQLPKELILPTSVFEPLNSSLPCDIHLVNLRSLEKHYQSVDQDGIPGGVQALLVLHRLGSDCDFKEIYTECPAKHGMVKWNELFSQVQIKEIEEMTLTGTASVSKPQHSNIIVAPMNINMYKITVR